MTVKPGALCCCSKEKSTLPVFSPDNNIGQHKVKSETLWAYQVSVGCVWCKVGLTKSEERDSKTHAHPNVSTHSFLGVEGIEGDSHKLCLLCHLGKR